MGSRRIRPAHLRLVPLSDAQPPTAGRPPERHTDEVDGWIAVLCAVVGLPLVAITLARGRAWGVGPTVGLCLLTLAGLEARSLFKDRRSQVAMKTARLVDRAPRAGGSPRLRWASAVALVFLATALCEAARRALALPDLGMLYLVAIMVAAVYLGRGPSILAAALSVAAYDFFFVPPYFTLDVTDARHLLTFATMFGVGLVISNLTARMRRQEQEAREAIVLARTEEMRSALLSSVSHDLRTPLSVITGAASALRGPSGALGPEHRAELVETICDEAEHLERLVANLLDMTRLAAGPVVLRREWVPLEEVIGAALARTARRLGSRPMDIQVPATLPLLLVDTTLVGQLFENLLENAAKYAPPGTPIGIRAVEDGAWIAIEVTDRGPGIPTAEAEAIFDRFRRGTRTNGPGVGLGLAICRAVVTAHGGRIVALPLDGGGTCMRIELPRPGEAPPVPDVPEVQVAWEDAR